MRSADARLAGALAAGLVLAALWVVSGVAPSVPFVPEAVAGLLIRSTPGGIATFFIELLGHWALRLLTAGVIAVCLALGAEALVVSARRTTLRPFLAGAILAGVSALALAFAPGTEIRTPATLLALVASAVLYGRVARVVYRVMIDRSPSNPSRRTALVVGLGALAGIALGGAALGSLLRRFSGPDRDVALVAPTERASIPARPALPEVEGLTPEVTSAARHYVVDINLVRPSVEAEDWRLEVNGDVADPLRLSFEDLQERFEVVEEYAVLTCVSNEVGGDLVGHSLWGGVRLDAVLERARIRPGAVDLVLRAADGYSESIPAELARDPSVILAIAQNRRPLTQDHGFPCRLRVPPIYGMKNVKWITSIEAVRSDYQGYWQKRGWSDSAVVRTQSRIDVAGEELAARVGEPTWIAGVAWAGDRGIKTVEISTDGGGAWRAAELREPIGPLSWRQWVYRWTPESPGAIEIACRATDGEGAVQTERLAPPHPAGATGHHLTTVQVS